jgi:hypothetical protein
MVGGNAQDLGSHQLWGGEAMTFDEILEQALEMLQRHGRVSYRALKVQFQLDDDLLDLLRDKIVEVHQLARDQEGKMLVWTGDTAAEVWAHSLPRSGRQSEPTASWRRRWRCTSRWT